MTENVREKMHSILFRFSAFANRMQYEMWSKGILQIEWLELNTKRTSNLSMARVFM